MRVRAAVLPEVGGRFEVVDVDLAPPRTDEVLVRVRATGLCASDLNAVDGKRPLCPFPAVLGHEAAGEVVECGPGVTHLAAGDHVLMSIVPSCGACRHCVAGRPNHCLVAGAAMAAGALLDGTSRLSAGADRLNHFLAVSAFAEYAVVPASGVVVLPAAMRFDAAALLSCAVLTGYGAAVHTADVRAGERVVVIGCGGVGLNIVQGARLRGAARIVAVDVTPEKLDLARRMGATDVVDAGTTDPVAAVRDLVGGADAAFEALGREETIQQAWRTLDVGGRLTLVGLMRKGATLTLDAGPFVDEQKVQGCYFGSADLRRDVAALVEHHLAGELLLDELISHRIGLDDLDEAFARLRAGEGARNVCVLG
jgi:S-(hydroxymethyl)glutathione dehydrogenase / alcohol dehydrogenase